MKYANLHLHSTYSDAQFTPAQLVIIGKALGYRAMALTDHETDGGVASFMKSAKQEGLKSVSGAEFYGKEGERCLHLTALDYDMDNPDIRAFIKQRCDNSEEYTRKCVERGIKLGFIEGFTWNDVLDACDEGTWFCIDSVINTMQVRRLVPVDYDWKAFRQNVFKGPEPKSFKAPTPTAEEVIRVVRKAGGVVALAHPNNQTHLVEKLVGYGLNGIEVSHPDLVGQNPYLALEAADTFHLYRCGGTDHTGALSGCGGDLAIPALQGITEEEFTILRERRLGR